MTQDALIAQAIAAADASTARGDGGGAIAALFEALVQRPTDAELHYRSGVLCLAQGRVDDAIRLLHRATALNPTWLPAWEQFSHALGTLPNIPHDLVLLKDVAHALTLAEINPTGALEMSMRIIIGRYGSDPDVTLARLAADRAQPLERVFQSLLVNFLLYRGVVDAQVEEIAMRLRASLLRAAGETLAGAMEVVAIEMLSAYGIQGFLSGYVLDESPEESAQVATIETQVRIDLAAHRVPVLKLAALAAYRPLLALGEAAHRLPHAGPHPAPFDRMVDIQISRPLEERALRSEIRKLQITETTSRRVQEQYEENPYPTWTMPLISQADLETANAKTEAPESILVAGAGTGRHPLRVARLSPQSEVVALDLSLASLAYGARQARVLGIGNVTFVQGDLLDVAALGRTFDRISSVGVLHHMADPTRGLAALKGVLRPGGSIELALYTESGRQHVVAGIALREKLGLKSTPEDFRRFRRAVRAVPADHPLAALGRLPDFYSLSELRDLVFHVQEHRFTLPRVKEMLQACGMRLEKFDVPAPVMAQFRTDFPGAEADIDAWTKFEATAPGIFGSMYALTAKA